MTDARKQRECAVCGDWFKATAMAQDVCNVCAVFPKAYAREQARRETIGEDVSADLHPSKRQMLYDLLRSRCPSEAEWAYESMLLGAALREEADEAAARSLESPRR